MWGLSNRTGRLGGDSRRARRVYDAALVRATLRGPVERTVLDIEGELDFTNAQRIVVAVRAIEQPVAEIDLRGLEFVDSAGARALRTMAAMLHRDNAPDVAMVGARRDVARVLELVDDHALLLA